MIVNGEIKQHTLDASKLLEARLKKRYTLREVEAVTGLSSSVISLIELGRTTNPSFLSIKKLCAVYEIGIETL